MELVGSFLLPLLCIISGAGFIIGWAKPVPFNPNLLKYKKWGPAMVAVAGPLMNILLAVIFAIAFRIVGTSSSASFILVAQILSLVVVINVSLAVFNLIPVPPLDGHHILGAIFPRFKSWSQNILRGGYGIFLLVAVLLLASSFIAPVVMFCASKLLGA
jgi:Zn-dependent protease